MRPVILTSAPLPSICFLIPVLQLVEYFVINYVLRLNKVRRGLDRVDGIDRNLVIGNHPMTRYFLRCSRRQSHGAVEFLSDHNPFLLTFAVSSASKSALAIGLGTFFTNFL
jgi:hypothetical protein